MIESARLIDDGICLQADVCIVGAGAAGITLALQFVRQNSSVVLIESGDFKRDEQTQALYQGEVEDPRLHSPLNTYRERRFGGSTTIWGGRCIPFDPIDFERRPYMPGSGWPFGYDTVLPYYPRANELCEAGDFAYSAQAAFPAGMRPLIEGFTSDRVTADRLERFSCPTSFAERYGHRLAASGNIRVLLNANCTGIGLSATGDRVDRIAVKTLTGRSFSIAASYFVLATGGLEVVRLLLASRDVQSNGVGNDRGLVGRYYMCHVAGTLGTLSATRPGAISHGYEISPDGIYCRRRFALLETTQRELGIGNFIARLHHPRITDPGHCSGPLSALYLARFLIAYEYGKRLHGEEEATWLNWLAHVRNVLAEPFTTGRFVLHLATKRFLAERKFPSIIVPPPSGRYSIDFHAEQQPLFESRVKLGSEVDALGMPRLHVDWRYSPFDVRTVAEGIRVMAEEFERSGCARLEYQQDTLEELMVRDGAYGGHHIGTTRMGESEATSVVNSDCRIHSVANLFIASSSVFPTSSQANPTLTMVALVLRLADHIKGLLDRPKQTVETRRQPFSQSADRAMPSDTGVSENANSSLLFR
jgi:choline dehydrogenase-like flavoprotein